MTNFQQVIDKTFKYDLWRGFFEGVLSTGSQTFVLFIAIRHFNADETTKALIGAAPFIGMLRQTTFPFFTEIPDPTVGTGRLAEWWDALEGHPVCKQSIDAYEAELKVFLVWLRDIMAKREQGGG